MNHLPSDTSKPDPIKHLIAFTESGNYIIFKQPMIDIVEKNL